MVDMPRTGNHAWCLLVMLCRSLSEIIKSSVSAPSRAYRGNGEEVPELVHVDTPLNRALVAACPSLRAFRPAWWARGPHAQTMAMAISAQPPSKYRREMFALPDGVQVALDWKEDAVAVTPATPIILCLHGMGGCQESQYLRVFSDSAMRRGYRAVVYNRRGHGCTSLLPEGSPRAAAAAAATAASGKGTPDGGGGTPKIFPKHSNMDDMMAVVDHLASSHPDAPLYLIGFSCGANLAINYLAESGKGCPFIAAASVSNGYKIWEGSLNIRDKDRIIDGVATHFLKGLLMQGRLEESRQLAQQAGIEIDWDAVMKATSVQEFERLLVVPAYGYSSLRDYYDEDSCHLKIKSVQTPLLCVCSRKDPLIIGDLLEVPREAARESEHILTVVTKHGGHMGWISGLKEEPWYSTLYFEYIQAVTRLRAQEDAGQGEAVSPVPLSQDKGTVGGLAGDGLEAGHDQQVGTVA